MPDAAGTAPREDPGSTLSTYARALYEDARLVPLLRRLMTASCTLTQSLGSSISIIDPAAGRYTKVAERGTACRLGQSFPLDEGVTGRVMVSRRPVVLASYGDVATGHLPPGSPARDGAVAAIPIWWRGDVIGANVVFAGGARSFSPDQVDQLEVLTQVVAPGIVTAAERDLAMAHLFRRDVPEHLAERLGAVGDPTGTGQTGAATASVREAALGLASLVGTALPGHAATTSFQVRVVRQDDGLRLLVHSDTGEGSAGNGCDPRQAGWYELADGADGSVRTLCGEAGPASAGGPSGPDRPATSSPFTAREREVVCLLGQGLSDRAIADTLLISPKTAEKHVGAVLRKTGATSRTAAVVRALERGWLPAGTPASG